MDNLCKERVVLLAWHQHGRNSVLIAGVLLVGLSCRSHPVDAPAVDCSVSARPDGRHFQAESSTASAEDGTIRISAHDRDLTISLMFPDRLGAHSIGPDEPSLAIYSAGTDGWLAFGYSGGGKIVVESIASDHVAGAFEFEAHSLWPAPPDDIQVTDGRFDCSLP